MKLGEFLFSLATKAGVSVEDDKLKNILSDVKLSDTDIDDTLTTTINRNLLTEDAALNNPKILHKARAEAYNRVDETIEKSLFDLLDPSELENVKAKKLTVEKVEAIGAYVKALKEAKGNANTKADKDAYQKQIDELNAALKAEKESKQNELIKLKTEFENQTIDSNLKLMLTGRPYKLASDNPEDKQFAIDAAMLRVKQQMQSKGYKVANVNGELQLLTNENLKAYDNNTEVKLSNFIEGAIAPLINPTPPAGGAPTPPPAGGGGNAKPIQNVDGALAAFDQLLKS